MPSSTQTPSKPSGFKHLTLAMAAAVLMLSACSVYKPDITQGNIVSAEQVSALKVGMSRQQVQQTLGSPLLQDVFNANRWDYVYRYLKGNGSLEQRVLTVLFDVSGKLASWSGTSAPEQKDISLKPAPAPVLTPTLAAAQPAAAEPVSKLSDEVLALNPNQSITSATPDAPAASQVLLTSEAAQSQAVTLVAAQSAAPSSESAAPSAAVTAAPTTAQPSVSPLLSPDINQLVGNTINAWRTAWMAKNLAAYTGHYAPDFKGELPSHEAWIAQRKRVLDAAGDISITLSDLKVIQTSNTEARAAFTQAYRSARLIETGTKNLFFQRAGDEWLIIAERFIKQN